MNKDQFINNFREAFGNSVGLPFGFWYSANPTAEPVKINGCMFKFLPMLRSGNTVSVSEQTLTCGGGKFYCGFTSMPERIPVFVSEKEKYKMTPGHVIRYLDKLNVPQTTKQYLNLSRIDMIENISNVEGICFLAEPDMLAGLTTWAYFDNNDDDAVTSVFGAGCTNIITMAVIENRKNGRRTFLGGFDPSVRPWFGKNELSYTIPMSRFKEMYETMRQSCLFDTHAWKNVKQRINQ